MTFSVDDIIENSRRVQEAVAFVQDKYKEAEIMETSDNWLIEYCMLNWGTDFLPHYETLLELQKDLEAHTGEWIEHESEFKGSPLYIHGLEPFEIRMSTRGGAYGRSSSYSQISSPVLRPGEIERFPNHPGGPKIPRTRLRIGKEKECLTCDNGQPIYLDDPENFVWWPGDMVAGLKKTEEGVWKVEHHIAFSNNYGIIRVGNEIVLNDEHRINEWRLRGYDASAQTPLQYIQSRKPQETSKAEIK